ncbi:MAG: tyrosine--tRNA ligase [Bacteroidota bacterium]|jgi:tyrosyl-tRNA synthetase|nr:tyrosine--tRNA ligase [Bacteroidota bacterium]OQC46891.1 MAG: Tyrosine--tRNA ligase [Bacteroidetes bacterium ADurb.Bin028]HNY44374.1 tyrosine--tRNA ligase [Bacteroidales bacterium]HOE38394.1 tyrosine--tRNA ligase [Bacteroidales bacterium]HOR61092.1 tyrosine--tRNA ligase [Bacteroidales bacterium]
MNFVEELEWRGMIHDMMPGTKELFEKEFVSAYVGIDPTADSLHIGHLVSVMMLKHLQVAGHRPIALLGGATGMIGDPSGKSQERNLLDEKTLRHNQEAIKKQLAKFLDFDTPAKTQAVLVNNYDWMSKFSFLEFIRDVGKHITVNYMMAKDSVKKRISGEEKSGMSFTEFSYQLVQGYDFLHLYKEYNCKLQMGGSDQWGNITTGTELIRRKEQGEAFALTCPLITKADGGKFGKTETGNVWLDQERTSPYAFYQFWLNVADEEAEKYIKIFTLLPKNEINELIKQHKESPHLRILQKKLAEEITVMVHSRKDYEDALEASTILFGNATSDVLKKLDEKTFLSVFDGVPLFNVEKSIIEKGIDIYELLCVNTDIFPSKSELRRTIQGNGLSINKEKFNDDQTPINSEFLINNKYILVQKGKKNYFLIIAS